MVMQIKQFIAITYHYHYHHHHQHYYYYYYHYHYHGPLLLPRPLLSNVFLE